MDLAIKGPASSAATPIVSMIKADDECAFGFQGVIQQPFTCIGLQMSYLLRGQIGLDLLPFILFTVPAILGE